MHSKIYFIEKYVSIINERVRLEIIAVKINMINYFRTDGVQFLKNIKKKKINIVLCEFQKKINIYTSLNNYTKSYFIYYLNILYSS